MRHVRLKPDRLRSLNHFEQFDHALPTVHAAPADLTFGGEPLAVAFSDVAGLPECFSDAPRIPGRISRPFAGAGRRVNTYDPVPADPQISKVLTDRACFSHLR